MLWHYAIGLHYSDVSEDVKRSKAVEIWKTTLSLEALFDDVKYRRDGNDVPWYERIGEYVEFIFLLFSGCRMIRCPYFELDADASLPCLVTLKSRLAFSWQARGETRDHTYYQSFACTRLKGLLIHMMAIDLQIGCSMLASSSRTRSRNTFRFLPSETRYTLVPYFAPLEISS